MNHTIALEYGTFMHYRRHRARTFVRVTVMSKSHSCEFEGGANTAAPVARVRLGAAVGLSIRIRPQTPPIPRRVTRWRPARGEARVVNAANSCQSWRRGSSPDEAGHVPECGIRQMVNHDVWSEGAHSARLGARPLITAHQGCSH